MILGTQAAREMIEAGEFVRRLFRPVRLVMLNTEQVAANEVRVELMIPAGEAVEAIRSSDLPNSQGSAVFFTACQPFEGFGQPFDSRAT